MNIQSRPRTVDYAGQTLYHARDVAEHLGYDDPSGAVRQHCRKPLGITQKEKGCCVIQSAYPRQPDSEIVISLSDVVILTIHSPKAKAEAYHYLDDIEETCTSGRSPGFGSLFKSRSAAKPQSHT